MKMHWPWIRRTLEILFLLSAIIFMALFLIHNWQEVKAYEWSIDPLSLFFSLGCVEMGFFFHVLLWCRIINQMGGKVGFHKAAWVWFLSCIARYIPGRFWQFLGMLYLLRNEEVSKTVAGISIIMAQLYAVAAGFVICLVFGPTDRVSLNIPVTLGLGVLLIVFFFPSAVNKAAVRFFKKKVIGEEIRASHSLIFICLYLLPWLFYGASFKLFLTALGVEKGNFLDLTGIFTTGYLGGLFLLLAPAGLGAREGVLAYFLNNYMSPGIAMSVSVLNRLIFTLAEFVGLGLAALLQLTKGRSPRTEPCCLPLDREKPVI